MRADEMSPVRRQPGRNIHRDDRGGAPAMVDRFDRLRVQTFSRPRQSRTEQSVNHHVGAVGNVSGVFLLGNFLNGKPREEVRPFALLFVYLADDVEIYS